MNSRTTHRAIGSQVSLLSHSTESHDIHSLSSYPQSPRATAPRLPPRLGSHLGMYNHKSTTMKNTGATALYPYPMPHDFHTERTPTVTSTSMEDSTATMSGTTSASPTTLRMVRSVPYSSLEDTTSHHSVATATTEHIRGM
jgi:hypothetical protein